jgi:hypothetical protein
LIPSTCTGAVNSSVATRSIRCSSFVTTPSVASSTWKYVSTLGTVTVVSTGAAVPTPPRAACTPLSRTMRTAPGLSGIGIGSDWTNAFAPTSS